MELRYIFYQSAEIKLSSLRFGARAICVCVYVCVYTYVCIYMYTHIHIYVHIRVCIHMYINMWGVKIASVHMKFPELRGV